MLRDQDDHPHAPFPFSFLAKKTQDCHQCQRHLLHALSRTRFWWLLSSFQLTFARLTDRYQNERKERERASKRAQECVLCSPSVAPSLSLPLSLTRFLTQLPLQNNELCTCDEPTPTKEDAIVAFFYCHSSLLLLLLFLFLLFLCQPI